MAMRNRFPSTSTSEYSDCLAFLLDYVETLESLSLELEHFFSLHDELNDDTQDFVDTVVNDALPLMDDIHDMDPNTLIDRLHHLAALLTETLKRGRDMAAMAKTISDVVEQHCYQLDADLVEFEMDAPLGPECITTQTRLAPSTPLLRRQVSRDTIRRQRLLGLKDGRYSKHKPYPPKKKSKQTTSARPLGTSRSQSVTDEGLAGTVHHGKRAKVKIPANFPTDPDEPRYCYCQQVSYGEMVACDYMECDTEWFHLACVGLNTMPKGKWYCDSCAAKVKSKQQQ